MAIATGAHSSFDEAGKGNREDLSDYVWDVTPADTPFISAIPKGRATATNHEWLTDVLDTGANPGTARLEGDTPTPGDPAARVRLGNNTQILSEHAVVTGTQERVSKAGLKSEMAYQVPRRMAELKTGIEYMCLGVSNAKVTGAEGTAREAASLDTYLANGVAGDEFAAATSANPTGDGTDTPNKGGSDRALTDTILDACLENLYTNSGGSQNVTAFCPASQKTAISGFSGNATRYVTTDDKRLVQSIDVYDGDFHTVRVVPDRFVVAGSVFIVDPKYMKLAELRPMFSEPIAKLGDANRKQIIWEGTLEVCDPNAHTHIFDLS